MKVLMEFLRVLTFLNTLPIPYGRGVVSQPLIACRNKRPRDKDGSSFFFKVLIDTVCFDIIYRSKSALAWCINNWNTFESSAMTEQLAFP